MPDVGTFAHFIENSDFWRFYIAFSLLVIAAVLLFIPQAGFGLDRIWAMAKPYHLSLVAQNRLERILNADYSDRTRARRLAYAAAAAAVVLAALCAVPAVPPVVLYAAGILAVTAAATFGLLRRRTGGPKRSAALVPRILPRSFIAIAILDIASMLCLAIDPALRAGALVTVGAIGGMWYLAWKVSAEPVSLRGDEPGLETAVASFIRADRLLTVAGMLNSIALFATLLGNAHHRGANDLAIALAHLVAVALICVAAVFIFLLARSRDFAPLANMLESSAA